MRQWNRAVFHVTIYLVVVLGMIFLPYFSALGQNNTVYMEVDEVILSAPPTWRLEKEIRADAKALRKFQNIYHIRAKEIVNQVFVIDAKRIQINYCLFDDAHTAESAALKMFSLVVDLNIISQKNNLVLEIISTDAFLKQDAVKLLHLADFHRVLLEREQILDNWSLRKLILVQESKIPFFEVKLGGQVDSIINQFFSVGDEQFVRINYIAAVNVAEAEKILGNLKKQHENKNSVFRKNSVVLEIISKSPALLNAAIGLF